jgi:hypothetical protein
VSETPATKVPGFFHEIYRISFLTAVVGLFCFFVNHFEGNVRAPRRFASRGGRRHQEKPGENAMSRMHLTPSPTASNMNPPGESGLFYDPVLRMGISWPDRPARPERASDAERTISLVEAVAGIVAIAAARAHDSGERLALRQAVERALGPQ